VASIFRNSRNPAGQTENFHLCGGKRFKKDFVEANADRPLVTVITAVFNGARTASECIESVLRQDYPNLEHIILDGGSSDGTVDVLR
jgi:cellulose synthase/poly-beta-1,6-N-acetylglucosamine synthase-like glycosyltransferase